MKITQIKELARLTVFNTFEWNILGAQPKAPLTMAPLETKATLVFDQIGK